MSCRGNDALIIDEVIAIIIVYVTIVVIIYTVSGNLVLVYPKATLQVGVIRINATIDHGHDNLLPSCGDGPCRFYVNVGPGYATDDSIALFVNIVTDITLIAQVPLTAIEWVIERRVANIGLCERYIKGIEVTFFQFRDVDRFHKCGDIASGGF